MGDGSGRSRKLAGKRRPSPSKDWILSSPIPFVAGLWERRESPETPRPDPSPESRRFPRLPQSLRSRSSLLVLVIVVSSRSGRRQATFEVDGELVQGVF